MTICYCHDSAAGLGTGSVCEGLTRLCDGTRCCPTVDHLGRRMTGDAGTHRRYFRTSCAWKAFSLTTNVGIQSDFPLLFLASQSLCLAMYCCSNCGYFHATNDDCRCYGDTRHACRRTCSQSHRLCDAHDFPHCRPSMTTFATTDHHHGSTIRDRACN